MRRLPSLFPIFAIVSVFAVGYFFPLTSDARVAYIFGWALAAITFVIVDIWQAGGR